MNGQKMSSGMVGFSTVATSLIKDMLPQGIMQLATTLTIQAPGVATFSTPLQVTFANVYGAAPGSQLDVYSFNHTTGMLEITGTATVSADGKTVTTDPDSGITHPGWFGVTPPGDCGGDGGPPEDSPPSDTEDDEDPIVLPLITGESGDFPTLTFTEDEQPADPPPPPPPGCPPQEPEDDPYLEVTIDVDGPLEEFMDATGSQPLESTSFIVETGDTETFGATAQSYNEMFGGLQNIDTNYLYGSKITVTEDYHHADGSTDTTVQPYYLYRLIDATDGNPNDGTISFEDTLTNQGITRTKSLDIETGSESQPMVDLAGSSSNPNDFDVQQGGDSVDLEFSPVDQLVGPSAPAGNDKAQLEITTPDGDTVPNNINLQGYSYAPMNFYVSSSDIVNALQSLGYGTPATDATLASQIITKSNNLLTGFSPGITVNGSSVGNTISVNFSTAAPTFMLDGNTYAVRGQDPAIDNIGKLAALTGSLGQYNHEQENYLLAEALNQSTAPKTVDVYLGTFVKGTLTADQLANDITKTVVHEAGHALGLVHTYSVTNPTAGGIFGGFGAAGQADIMAQGSDTAGTKTFSVTAPALTIALKLDWSSDQAQNALSYYIENYTGGGGSFYDLDSIEAPSDDLAQSQLPGPHLAIFNNQTDGLLGSGYNFGSVALDPMGKSPATASFTLVNYGMSNVQLTSVGLTGSSAFTVTGVTANQILTPGETVVLQIAFDPTTAGATSTDLDIVSNDPASPFTIPVTGFGQSASPSAQLTLANNDLGGISVGKSTTTAKLATISNDGSQPLVISSILVEAGGSSFTLTGVPSNLATNPITLTAGQSFTFGVTYTASIVGLERAKIDVGSNDPTQATLTFGVMGTGLAKDVYPHWGNDYVAIEFPNLAASTTLRTVSDANGHFSFFLPAHQAYHIAIFDPITGLIANGYGVTPASGTGLNLTSGLVFGPSTSKDTDYDGLPDDVEFAIGTNPNKAYTAGDGIDDFTHIIVNHTDALNGKPLATGVVASVPLNGDSQGITVVGSTTNAAQQTAYVATGSYGLAIVDASNPLAPVVLSQIALPGDSVGVAVDPELKIAAVASSSGLNLVDVSNPASPKLLQTVNVAATAVRVLDGIAYVANGTQVTAIDMQSGATLDQENFTGGTVDDLSIAQGDLYVLASAGTASHTVYKIALNGSSLPDPLYSATITGHPTFGRMYIFAGNGYVYVGASDNNDTQEVPGVEVLQDTGSALTLVGVPSAITGFDVAVDSSGLALYTGGLQFSNQVGLLDLSDPTTTSTVVTTFTTSGTAESIAIAGGYGFLADASGGLNVINFLPFDTKGVPPKASISLPASSIVGTSGNLDEVLEGSLLPILTTATDDVQVRNVELLVNGTVVENAVSYPFDLSQQLPTLAQYGSGTMTLQVEAIDTGGNVGVSNVITLQLVKDTTPPVLVSNNVSEGSKQSQFFHTLVLSFSKPLDPSTVTASTFKLIGPGGAVVPVSITLLKHNESVEITYPSLAVGSYQIVIDSAHVTDKLGNVMGTTPVTTDFTVQQYSAVWVNTAGGDWFTASNWQGDVLPKPTDDVLIDVPGSVSITFSQGTAQVNSLLATDPLTISSGQLTVTQTLEADGGLTIDGGTLSGAELKTTTGQTLTVDSYSTATLAGVKLDNDLTVDSGAELTITNGLALAANLVIQGGGSSYYGDVTFQGTQAITGTGKVLLGTNSPAVILLGTSSGGSAATLTIGSGITIQGQGTIGSSAYTLSTNLATIVNQGTIAVTTASQTLALGANLSNPGKIQVGDKDVLKLGGVETLADVQSGTITGTGTVQIVAVNSIAGAAINNTGKTLLLDSLPSWLSFGAGGGIEGGTVGAAAPSRCRRPGT